MLPRESSEQREQLVRRLAAKDSSIDLMSLDPPYIPEFAEAGFLAPVPEDVAERVTEDVVQSAIDGATWNDELVAVPFWANTQLLWYKKSVAEAAGLDMSTSRSPGSSWSRPRKDQDTTIAAQGIRAEALHRLAQRAHRVRRRLASSRRPPTTRRTSSSAWSPTPRRRPPRS